MDESMDVVEYLLKVMEERELIPADITKRSGLSPSQVSKVLNRESPAGQKALDSFAKALNLPPDDLYRRAGILPMKPNADEVVTEIVHIYHMLSEDNKGDLLDYAKNRLSKQEREEKKNAKRDRVA
jgi:transcriptional regulator with XRE-family HTH domain